MVGKSKVAALVILLVFIGSMALAQTPGIQETWFQVGYWFDRADEAKEITDLCNLIPGSQPFALRSALAHWETGTADKTDVRVALVAYAEDNGGDVGRETFRMGEWCGKLELAGLELRLGALLEDEKIIYDALVDCTILSNQVQEFIDALREHAPPDMVQCLEEVKQAATNIDLSILLVKIEGEEALRGFLNAVMGLSDNVDAIKDIYGVD